MPPGSAAFGGMQLLALLGALALLVCNAAAGLASRLAGGLALAATTVLSTVTKVTSFNSLNVFHSFTSYIQISIMDILAQFARFVKYMQQIILCLPLKD